MLGVLAVVVGQMSSAPLSGMPLSLNLEEMPDLVHYLPCVHATCCFTDGYLGWFPEKGTADLGLARG